MKKLLSLLFIFPLFMACSSDDDPEILGQDYTSFDVVYHANVGELPNCVAAYKKDNKYYTIASLGTLTKDVPSKEIKLNDQSISEIYIFSDYNGLIRFNKTFTLKINAKTTVDLSNTGGIGIHDKSDPTQYPQ